MATGRGQSLTPIDRADEVADIGMWDGILSGVCAAIPSSVGVWYGMKYSSKFAKVRKNISEKRFRFGKGIC